MRLFTKESLFEIYTILNEEFYKNKNVKRISFEVINPDLFASIYAGTIVEVDNINYVYRGYKAWSDLSQKLSSRMLTPKIASKNSVIITFEKLDKISFHEQDIQVEEKYGTNSIFSLINKNEEPEVLLSYISALDNVKINNRKRVLNLGVNSGEEFELVKNYCEEFENLELVGIDYCESAIKEAKKRFEGDNNVKFYQEDINKLESLDLGKFDLIISIGTLQSSNLEFNKIFMKIVQEHLKKDGAMILGFPNCRWVDGEITYGARVRNYSFSEMSVLFKDAVFCKKYLQQKKFRVTLTGKYYIFLTATSIRKN